MIRILKKEKPDLLNHLEFDPEAGGLYAVTDSEISQIAFVAILGPIFQDQDRLEKYIASANGNRIDD